MKPSLRHVIYIFLLGSLQCNVLSWNTSDSREVHLPKSLAAAYQRYEHAKTARLEAQQASTEDAAVLPAKMCAVLNRTSRVKFKNVSAVKFFTNEGEPAHYHHFFFGVLLPLIEFHLDHPNLGIRLLTDVGPMKSILCDMPLNLVDIVLNSTAYQRVARIPRNILEEIVANECTHNAYFCGFGYDLYGKRFFGNSRYKNISDTTILRILNFFDQTIPHHIRIQKTYNIILIERSIDKQYTGLGAKLFDSAGAMRRHFTNHRELDLALKEKYKSEYSNVVLEGSGIYSQYSLFKNAKVVIAQHGAALSNIFFMCDRRDSGLQSHRPVILEISSNYSAFFSNICSVCNLRYRRILIEKEVTIVNTTLIIAAVNAAMATFGLK